MKSSNNILIVLAFVALAAYYFFFGKKTTTIPTIEQAMKDDQKPEDIAPGKTGSLWVYGGPENGSETFTVYVDIAYGKAGLFDYKYNVTGRQVMSNDYFADKAPGIDKEWYFRPTTTKKDTTIDGSSKTPGNASIPNSSSISDEGLTLKPTDIGSDWRDDFNGARLNEDDTAIFDTMAVDVAFGSGGKFKYITNYKGFVAFGWKFFGDPNKGVRKYGYWRPTKTRNADGLGTGERKDSPNAPDSTNADRTLYALNAKHPLVTGAYPYEANTLFSHQYGNTQGRFAAFSNINQYTEVDFGTQRVDVAFGRDANLLFKLNVTGKITFSESFFGFDPEPEADKYGWWRPAQK